jgi:hypothetical protein
MPRPHIPIRLRRLVIKRAGRCCEYCLIHQADRPETHPIDHIIALKHGGRTEEGNLALACAICNSNKGSDLAALDPSSGGIVPLFNPRTQNWDEHFELSDAQLIGRTAIGRATVALLRLNDDERLSYRQSLIDAGRYPSLAKS